MTICNKLIPYEGIGDIRLYQSVHETQKYLSNMNLKYVEEIWKNEECTPPIPWHILRTENGMNLFYANDKLFKIYVEGDFDYALPNGIRLNMPFDKAKLIDKSLVFNDWDEEWESKLGYYLEDDIEMNTVLNITIYIPEMANDEIFDEYKW